MPATDKRRRMPWLSLGATWAVLAGLVFVHALIGRHYIGILDRQGLRGAGRAATPLGQVIPARYADAQMWVRNALDATEAGQARVRFTTSDNAPTGREVHWNSGFLWLLRGAAALQRTSSQSPPARSLEQSLSWFNAPLFFAVIVIGSAWAARRAGIAAGVVVACALFGHQRFREVFEPGYVDHHGVINAALLGLVLGAAFMGFGWHRAGDETYSLLPNGPLAARRGAVLSGICGAVALWLSASSSVAVIGLIAIGGLAATVWQGRQAATRGARFAPEIWQWWGRTGALGSALLYLLEYAPNHFGWRLEVNHPLYSLAWWGGAEAVAMLAAAWTAPAAADRRLSLRWPRLLLALGAVALPPFAIRFGCTTTFLASDPFVAELRHYVAESRSLSEMIRDFGFGSVLYDLVSALVIVAAAWLLWRRRPEGQVVLAALTLLNAIFFVMACLVVRWWTVASVLQITLLLWVIAAAGGKPSLRWRPSLAAALLLFVLPATFWLARDYRANRRQAVAAVDLYQPLYRDIAAVLRATQPDGSIVLLASPNASAGISYFGRFQSIGTLFWENAPGLRAAAEMLCATTDDEALRLVRARRITHVAVLTAATFVPEYFALLHPGRPPKESARTFGHRLAADPSLGSKWLQPIPYRPPPELAGIGGEVRLFKVAPDQTEDARLFHTALTLAARGQIEGAERAFRSALALVAAPAQASFCGFAGEAAYEQGAHPLALKMLRRGLELRADAGMANLTAWILATSPDASIRDGNAALALVRPLAQRDPNDPLVASTIAATYAELGRFDEAVAAADRALQAVRRAGADTRVQSQLQQRLDHYRARRPWRQ